MISCNSSERGVGLIEILVAVVLVAIGFLAAAQMQVQGMRFSQSAYFQSQAYFMASDMIDRMRANHYGVDDGAYDAVDTDINVSDPGCADADCSPTQRAQQDIFDWSRNFVPVDGAPALLPANGETNARGTVTAGDNGEFNVTITWFEVVDGEAEAQPLTLAFVPETVD